MAQADDTPSLLVDYAQQFGRKTVAISLQNKLSGQAIWTVLPANIENVYFSLGEIASAINRIKTSGLGTLYSTEHKRFFFHTPIEKENTKSRASFLAVRARNSLNLLDIDSAKRKVVDELITQFEKTDFEPQLVFGDFNGGNFLCDSKSAKVNALFDFETIRSDLGIQDELSGASLMMKPNEYEAFISGYALALKISPKEFKSLHANNIFASAWVRALVADTSDWRQNALKQLQPLLFDNNRW